MKKMMALLACIAPTLEGCSGTMLSLATAGPYAAIDYARGHLGVLEQPDGRRTFNYTVPADALDYLPADQREEQRKYMLASLMGSQGSCPGGYEIKSRQEVHGVIIFEGDCK